jgi:hypothetical protein
VGVSIGVEGARDVRLWDVAPGYQPVRWFEVDGPFLVVIRERTSSELVLVLWVDNPDLLEVVEVRTG